MDFDACLNSSGSWINWLKIDQNCNVSFLFKDKNLSKTPNFHLLIFERIYIFKLCQNKCETRIAYYLCDEGLAIKILCKETHRRRDASNNWVIWATSPKIVTWPVSESQWLIWPYRLIQIWDKDMLEARGVLVLNQSPGDRSNHSNMGVFTKKGYK